MDTLRAPAVPMPAIARNPDADWAGYDEPPHQGFLCPTGHCRERLQTTQPDEQDPNKLIGICRSCETWHLIELDHRTGRYELRGVIAGGDSEAA